LARGRKRKSSCRARADRETLSRVGIVDNPTG
jgi:hypothetical protein